MISVTARLMLDAAVETKKSSAVIPWAAPVTYFGDLQESQLATIGLNPSNREFVDTTGSELTGSKRRFQTLSSLQLDSWLEADSDHILSISKTCIEYFDRNPYDTWFKRLDNVISATGFSYYTEGARACHLDLVPFATATKWGSLSQLQRSALLELSGDSLGLLVRDSPIIYLVLNGASVVELFEATTGIRLHRKDMPQWRLPRKHGPSVPGTAYTGSITELCGIKLHREVHVAGYNHNIQSSFGVTRAVIESMREWVARHARRALS